ncbi:hypothetical protein IPC506_19565 [Pseudomonas aeruginosa]|nr:hypothetical protein IPC506_19565 [Pseudomonas aeruginosa]
MHCAMRDGAVMLLALELGGPAWGWATEGSMKKVITEVELSSTDVQCFDDVLLVKNADDLSGVAVFHARDIAKFYGATAEAEVTESKQLLVVVNDPDDPETAERVRVACAEAWSKR